MKLGTNLGLPNAKEVIFFLKNPVFAALARLEQKAAILG